MIYTKSAYRQFREEGYLVFPNVFQGKELEQLLAACNHVLQQVTAEHDQQHPGQDFISFSHVNDLRWHKDTGEHLKAILEAAADPRCLGPVEQIFDGPSLFRCTNCFVNTRFTSNDGSWHRDSQFGRSEQEERELLTKIWTGDYSEGFGLQFQIALVDNDDVEFVPYSINRFDAPEEAAIRLSGNKADSRSNAMPNALRIPLKAGDAVVFNPYGLHRGRYYKEIPRRTLMFTYTPMQSRIYDHFSHQPWFAESGYLEGLSPRATAYFQQFVEAYGQFWTERKSGAAS